jgi:hypothetical protein
MPWAFVLISAALASDVDLAAVADRDGLPAARDALLAIVDAAKNEKKLAKALEGTNLSGVKLPAKAGFGADFTLTDVQPMSDCRWDGELVCTLNATTSAKVGSDEFQAFCKSKYGATADIASELTTATDTQATWTIRGALGCWALNEATVQVLPVAHDDLEGVGTGDDDLIPPELIGLTKDQVDSTIEKQLTAFKSCVTGRDGPAATGKLVIAFHIADDGTLDKVDAKTSTVTESTAEACLLERFGRLKFVRPNDGYVDGTYEFSFQ